MIQKEEKKDVSREKRNKILKTQKALSGRMFNPRIYEKPSMVELVKYVRHQGWLHLLEEPTPMVFEGEVREFYYTREFSDDGFSLTTQVQGKEIGN